MKKVNTVRFCRMYASMDLLSEQLGAARMGIYTDTEKMKFGERE